MTYYCTYYVLRLLPGARLPRPIIYGYSLYYTRLQPLLHTVTASITYGRPPAGAAYNGGGSAKAEEVGT